MYSMHRPHHVARGSNRPPSAPPTNANNLKRKERDYEQETGDETNINVVVRCRGRNDREVRENSAVAVSTNGVKGNTVELSMGPNAVSNKTYNFDKVFSHAADQAIIFNDVVLPILSDMLSGYNCTIFAYGQTGTGKTYTMSGDMTESCGLLTDAAGVIPRVLQALFQKLEAEEADCTVKCSFIELYNEELRDLLSVDDAAKLKIYDDPNKKGHSTTMVQGLEESHITSAAEGIQRLQHGSHKRKVAATKCNDLSSRSHTVFTITTYVKRGSDSTDDYICSGKFNLVDLAGSENIGRSGAENKRAVEAGSINKSLLTLGRVINALVDKSSHIPYRESKLTRLLQDSLGGRTKTCIIATVSPARDNLEETISTLDYAFRAKNIRNKPQINSVISKKTLLKEYTSEIEKLKTELIATRMRNGVYLSNERFEELSVESESRRILSEEQKAKIETMEANLQDKSQKLFSLTNSLTSIRKDHESTKLALDATKDVLEKTEIVLAHTKQVLEEESALREKYAMNEEKLHGVGRELLSTIDESLRDVDGLHSKLRRRSALHAQNQRRWEAARDEGRNALSAVDNNLEALEQEHSSAIEATSLRIQSFISAELRRTEQAHILLEESAAVLTEKTREQEVSSVKAKEEMNETLEEIKVLRDGVKAKVGEGLNGLSDAAARIAGEVISELDQFHAQLHSSYSTLGKEIKAAFDDLTKQLSAQRDESDRLRKALQEANRKNIEASLSVAGQLEAAVEGERKAAEEDREKLMLQMTDLVNNSMRSREQRLDTILSSTQTSIVEVTEEFETADKAFALGMSKWDDQDTLTREKVARAKEDIKNRFKKDWSAVSDRNGRIQDSTKAVHGETVKIVQAQVEDMATQMQALDDFVVRARNHNGEHHEQRNTALANMSGELHDRFDSIKSRLDLSSSETFNIGIKAHLDEIASTFADVHDQAREPLHQIQEGLAGAHMADYVATGETPQRKAWSYPKELPRTIPLPESTTPQSKPPSTSSISRTPGRQRGFTSPRKSPKKQIVRVDTPPSLSELPQHTQDPKSSPKQLKELNVNLPATIPHLPENTAQSVPSDTITSSQDSKVSVTTTTSRLPTKAPAIVRSNSVTSAAEQQEKENVPAMANLSALKDSIVPIPVGEKSRGEKLSKSFYVPRMTRSSAAAIKTGRPGDFGRSMSG